MLLAALVAASVMPINDPKSWISDSDYPESALSKSEQGSVSVALPIGPDGRPKSCNVEQASGSNDLNLASCNLLFQRARFKLPVVDGAVYRTNIIWGIKPTTTELARIGTVAHMTIAPNGTITGCVPAFIGPVPATLSSPCRQQSSVGRQPEQLKKFETVDLRYLLEDYDEKSLKVSAPPNGYGYLKLNQAVIEVDPKGFVTHCRFVSQKENQIDQICPIFSKRFPDFEPQPKQVGIRKMTFTTDLMLKLRR